MPYVYILRCRDGSLYTGVALDLGKRVGQHGAGRASRYTRSRLPVALAWWREVPGWGEALREELRIKRMRREQKEEMVRGAEGDEAKPPGAPDADDADVAPDADDAKGVVRRTMA